jgi:hypothetical protein
MTKLETRIDRLEQARGQGTYCLLYTDTWSKEQLETQVARLKKDYSSVLTFLVDEADLAL